MRDPNRLLEVGSFFMSSICCHHFANKELDDCFSLIQDILGSDSLKKGESVGFQNVVGSTRLMFFSSTGPKSSSLPDPCNSGIFLQISNISEKFLDQPTIGWIPGSPQNIDGENSHCLQS